MMKPGWIVAIAVLAVSVAGAEESSKIQVPPLGFHTMDLTKEFWTSIDDTHRLKGAVADVLPYERIKRMIILRCNMHVPAGDYLDKFIRCRLAGSARFDPGPIPANIARGLRSPLLTVLVETGKGDLCLLTFYSDAAILEFNGRFGLVLAE